MIKAEIVAHSLNEQGDELISVLCTFPRILLSEVNTHRMLSKNTSSSRAIPFNKMVEAVQENPFIPIAWQKDHKGMQGSEYFTEKKDIEEKEMYWITASKSAINMAEKLNNHNTTKQLCNRLLEPFMWTTMLITGNLESWQNLFNLRCPNYIIPNWDKSFKSWKEVCKELPMSLNAHILEKLQFNKGQAEIHFMDLAEKIYDVVNESTPKQLKPEEWHIPMGDKIPFVGNLIQSVDVNNTYWKDYDEQNRVKISTALAARTSYTVVGDEKEIDYKKMIELHDRLISQNPPHSSPMEHCARAMSDEEYNMYWKSYGTRYKDNNHIKSVEGGWCRNLKGFIQYRHLIENGQGL